jgi:hypothetical protein
MTLPSTFRYRTGAPSGTRTCSARSCGRWFGAGAAGAVVVLRISPQHCPYMAFVVDQHPVGALGPDSLYPVGLDYSISPRRPARLEIIAG